MTKQEADRIIANNYPKCRVTYLGDMPAINVFSYRIGEVIIAWVFPDGHLDEDYELTIND